MGCSGYRRGNFYDCRYPIWGYSCWGGCRICNCRAGDMEPRKTIEQLNTPHSLMRFNRYTERTALLAILAVGLLCLGVWLLAGAE